MKVRPPVIHKHGFTLVEIVVAMTVLSIVVTILAGAFVTNADIFGSKIQSGDDISELRLAASRIILEMQAIRDNTSVSAADSSRITFTDIDGGSVDIIYNPGASNITLNGQTLAAGLGSCQFKYIDKSGNYISSPETKKKKKTDIWSIEVELKMSGQYNMEMISRAYPRNLP